MTALDRAIIKAYHRPSLRSGNAVAEPPAATPRVAESPAVPLSQALAELAATSAAPSEKLPGKLQQSSVRGILGEGGLLPPTAAEPTAVPVSPSIAAWLDQAFQATVTLEAPPPAEIGKTRSATTGSLSTLPPAPTVTISQESDETSWRPQLQVDRVIWPSMFSRLQLTAPAAIQQMTDGLLSICASGRKVLGLASCASGEGVTTLLLAAARKLLSQGRKVVLVDANWNNPQLAQSLGLLPQVGWEETLCGGLPLEEVVIESLADGLAVLPVREPSESTIAQSQIATSFDILAREFDVVLVDLGPLDQVEDKDTFSYGAAARMDAVILVQNVRLTTPNRLAEVRQSLAASNLRYVGTIQNFVAG